jgi:hypothetical protein
MHRCPQSCRTGNGKTHGGLSFAGPLLVLATKCWRAIECDPCHVIFIIGMYAGAALVTLGFQAYVRLDPEAIG